MSRRVSILMDQKWVAYFYYIFKTTRDCATSKKIEKMILGGILHLSDWLEKKEQSAILGTERGRQKRPQYYWSSPSFLPKKLVVSETFPKLPKRGQLRGRPKSLPASLFHPRYGYDPKTIGDTSLWNTRKNEWTPMKKVSSD